MSESWQPAEAIPLDANDGVAASVVLLSTPDLKPLGTGFLLPNEVVVTCAHNVRSTDVGREVMARLSADSFPLTLRARFPATAAVDAQPYPLPDVALLGHDSFDHPSAPLVSGLPTPGTRLSIYGYSFSPFGRLAHAPRHRVIYLNPHSVDGWTLLECLSPDPVGEGYSGSPVIETETGLVVGMVKYSNGERFYVVPATVISELVRPFVPKLVHGAGADLAARPVARSIRSIADSVAKLGSEDGRLLGTAVIVANRCAVTAARNLADRSIGAIELSVRRNASAIERMTAFGPSRSLAMLELAEPIGRPVEFAKRTPTGSNFTVTVLGAIESEEFGDAVAPLSFEFSGVQVLDDESEIIRLTGGYHYANTARGGLVVDNRNAMPFAVVAGQADTAHLAGALAIPLTDVEVGALRRGRPATVELVASDRRRLVAPTSNELGYEWDYVPAYTRYLDRLERHCESSPARWSGLSLGSRAVLHQEVMLRQFGSETSILGDTRVQVYAEPSESAHLAYEQASAYVNREETLLDSDPIFLGADRVRWSAVNRKLANIVVLGDPGSGKSWLVEREVREACEIARSTLLHRRVEETPVLFNAARLGGLRVRGPDDSLEIILSNAVGLSDDDDVDAAILRQHLVAHAKTGHLLVCVDGLDEVPSSQQPFVRGLIDRLVRRVGIRVIVTSRWSGYVAPFGDGVRYDEVSIVPFEPTTSADFIRRALDEAKSQHLIAALHENEGLFDLARNPLALTMLCVAALRDRLPSGRVSLYEMIVMDIARTEVLERAEIDCEIPVAVDRVSKSLLLLAERCSWGAEANVAVTDALLQEVTQGDDDATRQAAATLFTAVAQPTHLGVRYLHRTLIEYLVARALAAAGRAGIASGLQRVWYEGDWYAVLPMLGALVDRSAFVEELRAQLPDTGYELSLLLAQADADAGGDRRFLPARVLDRLLDLPGSVTRRRVLRIVQRLGGEFAGRLAEDREDREDDARLAELAALLGNRGRMRQLEWQLYDGEGDHERREEIANRLETLERAYSAGASVFGSGRQSWQDLAEAFSDSIAAYNRRVREMDYSERSGHRLRTESARERVGAAQRVVGKRARDLVATRVPAAVQRVASLVMSSELNESLAIELISAIGNEPIPLTARLLDELIAKESTDVLCVLAATQHLRRRPTARAHTRIEQLLADTSVEIARRCDLAAAVGWHALPVDLVDDLLSDMASAIDSAGDPGATTVMLDGIALKNTACLRRYKEILSSDLGRLERSVNLGHTRQGPLRRQAEALIRLCRAGHDVYVSERIDCLSRVAAMASLPYEVCSSAIHALGGFDTSLSGRVLVVEAMRAQVGLARDDSEWSQSRWRSQADLALDATRALAGLRHPASRHWLHRVVSAPHLLASQRVVAARALFARDFNSARMLFRIAPEGLPDAWLELAHLIAETLGGKVDRRLCDRLVHVLHTESNSNRITAAADALMNTGVVSAVDEVISMCVDATAEVYVRIDLAKTLRGRVPVRHFATLASAALSCDGAMDHESAARYVAAVHDSLLLSLPALRQSGREAWEDARHAFDQAAVRLGWRGPLEQI
jgi:hypothetical protein